MLITIGNVCNYIVLVTPFQLKSKEGLQNVLSINKVNPFTHYMVCEQNRLRINRTSIINCKEHILFDVLEQIDDFNWREHKICLPYDGEYILEMFEVVWVSETA
jgi:hypothetical protein